MKVTVEDAGPCRKIMHVEAPPDRILPEYNEVLKEYKRQAKLPGFRKGKAPEEIVEKHFLKEIAQDAQDRLVPMLYRKALVQESLQPVAVIGVSDTQFAKQDGLSFKVTVDVPPDFKLPKYRNIKLKGESTTVGDDQVEETIANLRRRFARYEDVTDRAVQKGDLAQIDYRGTCEGKSLGEFASDCSGLAEATDFWALVDEPEFLPGFPPQIEGMRVGEEKDIAIHFPDDHHVEAVAGKDAVYHTAVKGIREPILPELDEEFFNRFNVDSEEALRERIRSDLQEQADQNEERRLREEAGKFLLSKTKMDVPESIVEQETRMMVRDIVQRSAMQGMSREQMESQRDQIVSAAAQTSADRVKLSYILARIAEEEAIGVSDEEVQQRIADMASHNNMTEEQVREELDKRGTLEQLETEMRTEKAMDFLLENAKIK